MQTKLRAIGGQELVLGLSSKPLTAWGGLAVFASFCESLGLRQVVEQALASFQRTSPNALPVADHLIGFLAGVLTGASRFLHLERLRADQPLRAMFGVKRFCAPTTYARFFQSFTRQQGEDVFGTLTRWGLGLLPVREDGYTLDLDSTVLERWGAQEGVARGYNPRRPGRGSHHPLLAGLAECRWLLHGWLRAGNAAAGNHAIGFVTECLALAEGRVALARVRADSGFFADTLLTYLEALVLPYLIKARMTKQVKRAAINIDTWQQVAPGIEVAETQITLLGWKQARRLVVIRQEEAKKATPAHGRRLFELKGYLFQAIVTSLSEDQMDAVTVYRTYNARGEFENRIKELKRGCGLEGFCLESFRATECVLRTLMLLHNLIQHFQDRIGLRPAARPKKEGKRHVLETLRFRFFVCAASLGRSGRRRMLRLSASDGWWAGFQAALTRLSDQVPIAEQLPIPLLEPDGAC